MMNSYLGAIILLGNVAKRQKWIKNIAVMVLLSIHSPLHRKLPKTTYKSYACGLDHSVFLTSKGLVYQLGNDTMIK